MYTHFGYESNRKQTFAVLVLAASFVWVFGSCLSGEDTSEQDWDPYYSSETNGVCGCVWLSDGCVCSPMLWGRGIVVVSICDRFVHRIGPSSAAPELSDEMEGIEMDVKLKMVRL